MCECLEYDDGSRYVCEACVPDLDEFTKWREERYRAAEVDNAAVVRQLRNACKRALEVLEANTPDPAPTQENAHWYLAESMLRAALAAFEAAGKEGE